MAEREIKENVHNDGTYVVKKNRKESVIALIVCVLIAFAIWIYARNAELQEHKEQAPSGDVQQTEAVSPSEE